MKCWKLNYPGGLRYMLSQIENILDLILDLWNVVSRGRRESFNCWKLSKFLLQLWRNPIIDPELHLIYHNVSAAFSWVPYGTSSLQLNCTSMQFRNVFCDCHLKFYCCLPIMQYVVNVWVCIWSRQIFNAVIKIFLSTIQY